MAAVWDKARTHVPTAEDRATLYSAGLHAAAVQRAGLVAMHSAAGTNALYIDCPLERSLRDLQTMEWHVAAQPLWLEDAGRVLLGASTDESIVYDLRHRVSRGREERVASIR
jgi:hypothetical protein